MRRLLPLVLAILGLAAGTGAGLMLKPQDAGAESTPHDAEAPTDGALGAEPHPETASQDKAPIRRSEREGTDHSDATAYEYVKLNNQFVVPVVSGAKVSALVVMSLSVEIKSGYKESVFGLEPKLRDAFLQVLFNHANTGGFDGAFTNGEKMNDLRGSLYETAVEILGQTATDVLVIDIVRQDV